MPVAYTRSVQMAGATSGAMLGIRTGSGNSIAIETIEWWDTQSAASFRDIILVRPDTQGTASTSVTGLPEDPDAPASATNLDTAWSVAPTVTAANALRRWTPSPNAGNGGWYWDDQLPLVVPASSSILVWNNTASAAPGMFCFVQWEE